jgi:hypothetical protein
VRAIDENIGVIIINGGHDAPILDQYSH